MPPANIVDDVKRFLRERLTPAVRMLFVLNVAIFLVYWMTMNAGFWSLFECSGMSAIRRGFVWQLVTYAFLHGDPFHLLFNMLLLWFLGPLVERRIGTSSFYRVYFVAAILGGVAHGLMFFGTERYMIGASGAVMAVAVICAIYYFDMPILLFGVFPIKLGYFVIIMLVMDALFMIGPSGGAVAHYAHLAGAGVGYAYVKVNWGWIDIWRWRLRAILAAISPVHIRRGPKRGKKGRVVDISKDDYFKR